MAWQKTKSYSTGTTSTHTQALLETNCIHALKLLQISGPSLVQRTQTPGSGASRYGGVYSFSLSCRRYSRLASYTHTYLYYSQNPSTGLYPCTLPSHPSVPVISHRTPFWFRSTTTCKACLCPFFLQPQTRIVERSLALTCPNHF